MEEAEIREKRRERYLLLEKRIRAFEEALRLRKQGLTCKEIVDTIHRLQDIRINRATVGYWIRGIQHPLGRVNNFEAKPSPILAHIIGVKVGDGWLYNYGYDYEIGLNVNDYEFAARTGRNLAKLLGQEKPYQPRWDRWHHYWRVICYSILLYHLLDQPWRKLKPYIEQCRSCVAAFLKAFFDGEGSIRGRKLRAYNTDKELLLYIQQLLKRYYNIEATGPHKGERSGHRFRSPANGKYYKARKTVLYLQVLAESLPMYRKYIGFAIKRKQRILIEAIKE